MALAAAAGLMVSASSALSQVQWRSTGDDSFVAMAPAAAQAELVRLAGRADAKRVLVQFDAPVAQADRTAMEANGLTLLNYLSDNAYFATIDAKTLNAGVATDAGLISARAIDNAWKIGPLIASGNIPDYASDVGGGIGAGLGNVAVNVVFHKDSKMGLDAADAIINIGGVFVNELVSMPAVVAYVPVNQIDALASNDDVMWIETVLPPISELNDSNRVITQVNIAQDIGYNLSGAGVVAFVFDGGAVRASHNDFGGRATVIDGDGLSNHATHVMGTVGGDGSGGSGGGVHRGMAPETTLLSAGFNTSGGGIFLYSNPGDIEADYGTAINNFDAVIANNSIGTNTERNGFPCEIQGDYGVTASVIDSVVRGSLGREIRVVWANGNERGGSRCDIEGVGDYRSTAPPAGAKNHITVGALNSNNDSVTSFTSWGPVDDGRLKPDVSAPGCQQGGDGGVTSSGSSSDNARSTLCGTSMASPTACGIGALIMEDYRNQFPGRPEMLPSTLKTIMAQTAQDIQNTGPDYQTGYGSIRAADAVDLVRSGNVFEAELTQGELFNGFIDVQRGSGPLKVTIAWDDFPGSPNVIPSLVNDLDLRLISPSGQEFFPWTLNPNNPSAAAVRTQNDSINNIEQVQVDNPESGTWRLEVRGTAVPEGPQTFSVASSDALEPVLLSVTIPDGVPSLVGPGEVVDVDVQIQALGQSLVGGSEKLFFKTGDDTEFTEIALTPQGGDVYSASLPAAACDEPFAFYVQAEGDATGVTTNPPTAPEDTFNIAVGVENNLFLDTFETDQGWTVTNGAGLTDGAWTRGVPANGGRADPPADGDGSGQAFLTDNVAGNSDVDGGSTTLTSPIMNGLGENATLSYYRWFSNDSGDGPNSDPFTVEISNDGGDNWQVLEVVGPAGEGTSGGWFQVEFLISDVLTPTDQMRVRFTAEDRDPQSVVEAAVDGVRIDTFECEDGGPDCVADWDGNGATNAADVGAFLSDYFLDLANGTLVTDFDENGVVNAADVGAFLSAFFASPPECL